MTTQTFSPSRPIWCAGCGDFGVRGALEKALDQLQIPRHQVLTIAGIGCSGTLQNGLASYGYHALHGRLLPTALGAKLANPQLMVIGVGGDGDGFAIGAGHLVHTLKRNVSLVYIVMNNGTYGLTKGQASPTSPVGYRQSVEEDLDPMLLGLSLPGTTFLARGFAGWSDQMERLMVAALQHAQQDKGMAFYEVLSPCVTYRDTYREWRARLVNVDEDEHYNPRSRARAFTTTLELRQRGRLPAGLLFEGEHPSLESQLLKPDQAPLALQDLEPGPRLKDYRKVMQTFMG